jgi:regulator of protease activity HflC (stomatin/prohibitin superfamily)
MPTVINLPGNKTPQLPGSVWKFALPAIIVLAALLSCFYTVGPGNRGVVVRLGAVQPGVVQPGAHLKIPFVDQVVELDVRVQKFQSRESSASKDLQDVSTTMAINFHLDPNAVDQLYKSVGTSEAVEQKILVPALSNAVKAVTAHYNAEDLIAERDEVRRGIEKQIRESLTPYNVTIDAVNITNFSFSAEYSKAIENKQVAQQRALQANYELQKTQIDSQQQVVKAEAQAKATVLAAEAESKALELKRKAVTPELIMLDAVQKWDGKLPTVYGGGNGGMMQLLDMKSLLDKK